METLNKALDTLEVFLNLEDNSISFSELVRLSKLSKGTANRTISVLVQRGYLNKSGKRGKYSLSTKLLDFNRIIVRGMKVGDIAKPHLSKLGESVQECVALAIRGGEEAFISEVIESKDLLRTSPEMGTAVPLYCSGLGKAILAHMTIQEVERYLRNVNLRAHTKNTITDLNRLRVHLMKIVENGVAYDYEEQNIGVNSIAVAIHNTNGIVCAAVGVLGPSLRLTRVRMREITSNVKNCALEISKGLGYKNDRV